MNRFFFQLIFVFALLCALATQNAHATWNASWTKRAKLPLNTGADGLQISSATDNVPVLVRLHTGNFQFLDAKPDGSDLRFIAADDKTPLKHHIEKFDAVNELALVWLQMPKLTPGNKSEFVWIYYGNANAPPANDAKGSYDAQQGLVYHFADGETLPQDSTANANHATRSSAKSSAAGLIGNGLLFDGKSDVAIAVSPSLKATANGFTLSMWIKPSELNDAQLYNQQEGSTSLSLQIRGGKLVAQAGATNVTSTNPVAPSTWQHVALVVKEGLTLYVNGQAVGNKSGSVPAPGGTALIGRGFKGELDELQIATVARSADWLKLAAGSQGPDQKLVGNAAAEGASEDSGPSYLKILLGAVTIDGWVVIAILGVMSVLSTLVMISKALYVNRVAKANSRFMDQFVPLMNGISPEGESPEHTQREEDVAASCSQSQILNLYKAGTTELRGRFEAYRKAGREMILSEQSIEAIRATVEARLVRELQKLNSRMVVLTISIAGGPFLGLLGTVVGVMITFAAIAAAGDVNVNAIAPGIAAALVATVAGLAVAIPALFGYNYLTGRIGELTSDMQVFVDELTTRIAENHSV